MKTDSIPKKTRMLLIAGLLIISFTPLIAHFFTMPDALRGALMGVGIGLEILALIRASAYRRQERSFTGNQ